MQDISESSDIQNFQKRVINPKNLIITIQNHSFEIPDTPIYHELKTKMDKAAVVETIKAVGRIESSDGEAFYGTGWFIAKNTIITNNHVLSLLVNGQNRIKIGVRIDLIVEFDMFQSDEYKIKDIIYPQLGNDLGLDIALLRVKNRIGKGKNIVKLASSFDYTDFERPIACIGYPDRHFNGSKNIFIEPGAIGQKNISFGFIRQYRKEEMIFEHDCSTAKGNSGSVIIDALTGKAIGLHFGYNEANNTNEAVSIEGITQCIDLLG